MNQAQCRTYPDHRPSRAFSALVDSRCAQQRNSWLRVRRAIAIIISARWNDQARHGLRRRARRELAGVIMERRIGVEGGHPGSSICSDLTAKR
jgi:hypothetical protein